MPLTAADLSFDPARHEYRTPDGLRVPSVTEILQAVGVSVDYEALGARSETMADAIEAARALGTAVHLDCHAYDDNDLHWASVDPRVKPYVRAWGMFRNDHTLRPVARERRVFHPTRFYSGTLDGIFHALSGRRVLVDIKTGDPAAAATHLQTAGYHAAYLAEHPDERIDARWGVHLTPEARIPYRIYDYRDWRDFGVFEACVTTYQHQAQRRSR